MDNVHEMDKMHTGGEGIKKDILPESSVTSHYHHQNAVEESPKSKFFSLCL